MSKPLPKYPAVLVLTGASGAGKTSLILKLNCLEIPGVEGINCDRVSIDVPENTEPSDVQAEKTSLLDRQNERGIKY